MSEPTEATESTEVSEASEQEIVSKRTGKTLSPEKLAQLQAARQKALEKRKMLAELARKEKQIKEDAINQRMARIKEYEEAKQAPKPKSKPVPLARKPKKPPTPVESDLSSTDESSSDESVEYIPVRKSKMVKAKVPKHHTTSELTAQIAREELQKRIARENMEVAWNSLFPGYRLMH